MTEHSVGSAAVAGTVHHGELSPMAKATMPWPTVTYRGVRRGSPTFTVVNIAGNRGGMANSVYFWLRLVLERQYYDSPSSRLAMAFRGA